MEDRIKVFKRFVEDLAQLSKCTERKVAAIITDYNLTQVHSIGINGGAKKQEDCMCVTEGKYGCLHAEINCLTKCVDKNPSNVMFVTLAPCKQCAAAIINQGFTKLYYCESWKDDTGLRMISAAGIEVVPLLKSQAYIIGYRAGLKSDLVSLELSSDLEYTNGYLDGLNKARGGYIR